MNVVSPHVNTVADIPVHVPKTVMTRKNHKKMQVHSRKCLKFYYNYSIYSSYNVVTKNTYFGTNTIVDFMFPHKKNNICLFVYMLPLPSELRPKMAAKFAYIG